MEGQWISRVRGNNDNTCPHAVRGVREGERQGMGMCTVNLLCCVVSCCIVLCCVVLCCAVLCCVALCCAVLRCVVLCCVVLCSVV